MNTELRKGINWVGYIDWTVRDFHGYKTESGSTYNAYLIEDEYNAVIDGVKGPYAQYQINRIAARVDLESIKYVVCNHAEPDHSGGLPDLMKACPNAVMVCNAKCKDALEKHYDTSAWTWQTVDDGDTISLGKRSLTFINTPMVHWPESMFTFVPEEKLLFSMDAFGQHFATAFRFDDEEPLDVIMHEAKAYYANIVMLYGRPIAQTLDKAAELDIEMIAPSHGVIWRSHIKEVLEAYRQWVVCKPEPKVIVLYATMWGATRQMAEAILEGVQEHEVEARFYSVDATHSTTIATEVLDCAAVAIGSSTLNNTLMPNMAGLLCYLGGLRPTGKKGFAFGSYGWSKRGGATEVEDRMKDMKIELMREPIRSQYVPTPELLEKCREAGRELGKYAEQYKD
ncbi:FprA family A-type flavoprotein [Pontiella agarivorans]|uniref:FprA family A-type flavoprotein n=1 Tax=Pontiella agarivorans TaxID=3038953 RepID=A0ABU5MXH9_9BACT|nr:FprA family A-type flavoprotein [Pontiella agarivorans]MDZ8118676.1 FprA family A-type flavoprotein [Pontiella agarivorans]